MGPSCPNGERAIDTLDWRTQLQSDARESIVNMMYVLLYLLDYVSQPNVYVTWTVPPQFLDFVLVLT